MSRAPKNAATKRAGGRPRTHDRAAVMHAVCELIATGMLVKDAAAKHGVAARTIREWGLEDEFAPLYARARESQAHALGEEVIAIADEAAETSEAVLRNRLRAESRKWLAAKLAPKLYGERIDVTSKGEQVSTGPQVWVIGGKTLTLA